MKMKKIISLIALCAILLGSFVACDESESTTGTTDVSSSEEITSSPDESSSTDAVTSGTDAITTTLQTPVEGNTTVSFRSPAILADVGKTVDLSLYDVEFKNNEAIKAQNISWSTGDITIEIKDGRYVTPEKSGVYLLSAKSGNASKTVYLTVKNEEDTDYILYENDFSKGMSGIDVIQKTSSTVSVSEEKLVLAANASSSSYARILFPKYLGDFSNYTVEASCTLSSPVNEKRWTSIMFRVQNNDYPYYQMAVRSNATLTNGVEIAERTPSNSWSVPYTGSYTSKLDANTEYKFKLVASGTNVSVYINGKLIKAGTDLGQYIDGRIGLQANGCKATYDDIKITLDTSVVSYPTQNVDVRNVTSNIIAPSSMITEIKTKADFDSILDKSPAAAIFTVDSSLNVLSLDGSVITDASGALEKLDYKVLPVFRPKDKSAAEKIAEYTSKKNISDSFVISSDESIIASARGKNPYMRAILDVSGERISSPTDLRSRTNKAKANICLISSEDATSANVNTLQSLATVVWVKSNGDSLEELVKCITSGAYGIVSSDRIKLESALSSSIFAKNTIVRPVNVIGHRGMPSIAQENTIAGSLKAVENGANIVENDVYLTKDGVVVVMHDGTIDRTTNGTGNIESMTLAELSQYKVDSYTGAPAEPIPTLEDYLKEFSGTDVILYIEIKSGKPEIVPAIRKLLEKYNFFSQTGIIAFSEAQMKLVREQIPEISCGYLSGSLSTLYGITSEVYENATTFNPSYGNVNKELLYDLYYRGISVWPYTLNKSGDFDTYFLMGISGITTNYSNFVGNYLKSITTDKSEYSFVKSATADVKLEVKNYKHDSVSAQEAEMVVVSGNQTLKFENGKLGATATGNATILFRISYKLSNGQTVYIYTQPISVSVN